MKRSIVSMLMALATAGGAWAQGEQPATKTAAEEIGKVESKSEVEEGKTAPETPKSMLSLEAGVDFTNSYTYRGYVAQDRGLITQPHLTLQFNVPELQSGPVSVTPYIGIWSSTSTTNDSPENPKWLYEVDYYAGAKSEWNSCIVDIYYQNNSYPGGVWHSTNELDLTLSYDDTTLMKETLKLPFVIAPHATVVRMMDRSDNLPQGPDTYVELGIEPAFDVQVMNTAVTVSFPTNVGLSLDRYYLAADGSNQAFGFASTGLRISVPLPMPEGCGEWKIVGSVIYYRLNATSVVDSNHGEADEVVGTIGIGWEY